MAGHEGMGAIIHEGGVAFRVWAPNADAVSVVGEFNDWDEAADPMTSEGDGYWYADVATAVPGHEYRFSITAGDETFTRIDPYAMQVTNSVGNGCIYDHSSFDWEGDDFTPRSLNDLVIYEMHVGSFAPEGDGVGTLTQVERNLDHLLKLGVNCIELMPVMEFAGDYSWGYNPAHIFAVESAYGGPDALKMLVREAHRRGISIIIDVVYNHLGPSDLDLWRFDGWGEPDKGGIYFFNDWRSATPWGDTRPDYGRGEVRQFLRDNALMWLEHYRVQGLRFDMTPYMRSVNATETDIPEGWTLCRWINDEVRERFPGAVSIAEDLHGMREVVTLDEDGAGFHSQWDSMFVHPIREALITPDDAARSIPAVCDAITYSYGDAFARTIYTESHDEVANGRARVPYEIDEADPTGWYAQKRSTLGAALTLTSPGVPMLFQGQEFLQGEWFRDDVPLDWDLNEEFHGIVRLYRDLIRLRLNTKGTSKGLMGQNSQILHADDEGKVLAYHRFMDGGVDDDVVVVVNLSNTTWTDYRIAMPYAGEWTLRLNSDAAIYSDDFGNAEAFDAQAEEGEDGESPSALVTLAPYSVLVYTRAS